MLGANIQNLVFAGALLSDAAIRKKVLTQWPFTFAGMRAQCSTQSVLEANLARHFAGRESRTLGRQRMDIWVTTHRSRSHTHAG